MVTLNGIYRDGQVTRYPNYVPTFIRSSHSKGNIARKDTLFSILFLLGLFALLKKLCSCVQVVLVNSKLYPLIFS